MDEFKMHTLFLTLIVAMFFAWHFGRRLLNSGGRKKLPPSPPSLPIIGNLHQVGKLSHRSLRDLSTKYGPLMLLHFGSKPVLVVSSADAAKAIMKTHDLAFANKIEMNDLKKIFYDMKDLIYLPYGDEWKKLRSIFVQELMRGTKSYKSMRDEEIEMVMEKIRVLGSSSRPVNLTNLFTTLSCDLIGRATLGRKHGEILERYEAKFLELMEEAVELLFNFSVGEFIPWLRWFNCFNGFNAALEKCAVRRDEILDAIVEDHLNRCLQAGHDDQDQNHENENFVDILLGIYKGNTPGVSIDLISVKALILDVFAAGTETSSSTLIWAMTELIRHPRVMKKLQDEIREMMKGKAHISEEELQKMRYLKGVIKETLRFHPPVSIYLHSAREYVKLMGFDIAPATAVLINAWAIGRDPASWDEPEKFIPERFLNSSVDFTGFDFQMIPFGAGRRICPGFKFAENNIEHILANLIHKFDWALPDGAKGEDLDVSEKPGFTIRKKNPLLLLATLNSNNALSTHEY